MNPEPQRDHQPICCALPDWRPAQGALQLGRNTVHYQPEPWPQLKRHMQCAVGGDHTVEKAKASCRGPIKPLEFTGRLKACRTPQVDVTECVTWHKKKPTLQCTNTVINSNMPGESETVMSRRQGADRDRLMNYWFDWNREGRERETGRDGEAGQLAQINFEKQ